jgi:hypothetical protein
VESAPVGDRLAGWALVALTIPMWWWDYSWPAWVVGIINPALVIGVAWGFSRWKRCTLSRVLFWAVLAIQSVSLAVGIATAFSLKASGWYTTGGLALIGIIWALWRMPHLHPAEAPKVSYVVHHHVLHGPGMAEVDVTQLPGTELPAARPRAVPGRVLRAIEAPKLRPAQVVMSIGQALRRTGR